MDIDPQAKGYIASSRVKYSIDIVQKYLDKNGIEAIISGHQDNVSIGILPSQDSLKDHYRMSGDRFDIPGGSDGGSDILQWYEADKLITSGFAYDDKIDMGDKFEFDLFPGFDFLALTMSTAVTRQKNVNWHTYMTLKFNP